MARDEVTGARGNIMFLNGHELRSMTHTLAEEPDDNLITFEAEFMKPAVIIDRDRFDRLRSIAQYAVEHGGRAHGIVLPGDLDPIE